MHASVQNPATQNGAELGQFALVVHASLGEVGWQTPFVHVKPAPHGAAALQPGRH